VCKGEGYHAVNNYPGVPERIQKLYQPKKTNVIVHDIIVETDADTRYLCSATGKVVYLDAKKKAITVELFAEDFLANFPEDEEIEFEYSEVYANKSETKFFVEVQFHQALGKPTKGDVPKIVLGAKCKKRCPKNCIYHSLNFERNLLQE